MDIKLSANNLHWLGDDCAKDLCAHGSIELIFDGYIILDHSDLDWCVSATALHLLRTLASDHTNTHRVCEHLITHCGNGMYESFEGNVEVVGCGYGIDFEVVCSGNLIILEYFSEDGHKVGSKLSKTKWKQIVFNFADKVQEFYQISPSKKLDELDEYEKSGYIAFWKEWNLRRNT